MKLHNLSLKDKALFSNYLKLCRHELSTYAFQNIYIWKGLFQITWAIIEDRLCVFFQDKIGSFLYLAPLGGEKKERALKKIFQILDGLNKNKDVSRIENVEAPDAPLYQALGYDCTLKSYDYLSLRSDLAELRGVRFKSKRSSFNYFSKHYEFQYLPFSPEQKKPSLELYDCWTKQRESKINEPLYQAMLRDSRHCLRNALDNYPSLNLVARVVKVNSRIKGFTCGFKLNDDTFSILYETTDLSIKGLAQFIFRAFARELKDYKYINIMDDSGLQNLKNVKLSYHPARLIPAYIVRRKDVPAHS